MTSSCLWAMWWLGYRSGRRGARRDGEKLTERAVVRASLRRWPPAGPGGIEDGSQAAGDGVDRGLPALARRALDRHARCRRAEVARGGAGPRGEARARGHRQPPPNQAPEARAPLIAHALLNALRWRALARPLAHAQIHASWTYNY